MARPREFDQKAVVEKVTRLFWEKGFYGTTLDDLIRVTGLKKGSLYHAFGDKEALFKMALHNYVSRKSPGQGARAIDRLCSFYSFLVSEARLPTRQRRGCLIFNSCLEFANKPVPMRSLVLAIGKRREKFFSDVIREAQTEGDIPKTIDCRSAAQRAFATAFSLREIAKFKPDEKFLSEIANAFLASLKSDRRVQIPKRRARI